jgi:hypothetical protein
VVRSQHTWFGSQLLEIARLYENVDHLGFARRNDLPAIDGYMSVTRSAAGPRFIRKDEGGKPTERGVGRIDASVPRFLQRKNHWPI